jgi:general secretion pathway protein J
MTNEQKNQIPATNRQKPVLGFTLMELMLAIMILGLVVTTVLASFNTVFSTTDALQSNSQIYEMAKNCLKRMSHDLESVYIAQPPIYKPPKFDDPPNDYRIVGLSEDAGGTGFAKIRFTSRAHLPLENTIRGGVAEIVYYLQAKEDGSLVLRRSDNSYPYPEFEENGSDPILCERVKSVTFKYYDAEGSEYEAWDSESDEYEYATPTAIEIRLEIADSSGSQFFGTLVKLPVQRSKIE